MHFSSPADVYSLREVAQAAGASDAQVRAVCRASRFVRHADAVRIGRSLIRTRFAANAFPPTLFSRFQSATFTRSNRVPLAVASTLHAGLVLLTIIVASLGTTPRAAILSSDQAANTARLVFLALPGPGGGGGGGGELVPSTPQSALREGDRSVSSPIVVQQPPAAAPVLQAESLPVVIAPVVTAPADIRNRVGVLEQTTADVENRGAGQGGGAGTGNSTGLGEGQGNGIGAGSGGGTGGGPYRAGSGVEPPRLLHEEKADYTEEARQRGLSGDVVLEIVVRRDGSVGDVKVLQGLGGGLNERAVDAVRRWRFSPAHRLGAPVDVIVEVAVEFKLR